MKPFTRFDFPAWPAQGAEKGLARTVLAVFARLPPSSRLAAVLLYAAEFSVAEAAVTSACSPLAVLDLRQKVRAAALRTCGDSVPGGLDPAHLDQRIREALAEIHSVPPGLEQRLLRCIAESNKEIPNVGSVSPRDRPRRWR